MLTERGESDILADAGRPMTSVSRSTQLISPPLRPETPALTG